MKFESNGTENVFTLGMIYDKLRFVYLFHVINLPTSEPEDYEISGG